MRSAASAALALAVAWLAGAPGLASAAPSDSRCFACHEERFTARVAHLPAAAGQCAACHEVRPEHLEDGEPRHVRTSPVERTCLGCHPGAVGRGLRHRALDAPRGCLECHDPHGGEEPRLLRRPLGKLCAGCHEAVAGAVGDEPLGTHRRPAACLECHAPHAAPRPRLLQREPSATCLGCHERRLTVGGRAVPDIRWKVERAGAVHGVPSWKEPSQGRNVARDCLACHLAHPRAGDGLMQRAAGNDLCFRCHEAGRFPAAGPGRRAHPGSGHPVDGGPDPLRPARPFGCVSCHEPHGASQPELLRYRPAKGVPSTASGCVHCHPEVAGPRLGPPPPAPPWHEEDAK